MLSCSNNIMIIFERFLAAATNMPIFFIFNFLGNVCGFSFHDWIFVWRGRTCFICFFARNRWKGMVGHIWYDKKVINPSKNKLLN